MIFDKAQGFIEQTCTGTILFCIVSSSNRFLLIELRRLIKDQGSRDYDNDIGTGPGPHRDGGSRGESGK